MKKIEFESIVWKQLSNRSPINTLRESDNKVITLESIISDRLGGIVPTIGRDDPNADTSKYGSLAGFVTKQRIARESHCKNNIPNFVSKSLISCNKDYLKYGKKIKITIEILD